MSHESKVIGWAARIEAEYREMPGLQLTDRQIQRLWGLDRTTCAAIVNELVSQGVLIKTDRNAYARIERRDTRDAASIATPRPTSGRSHK
jgi:hypothetical protein